MSISKPLLPCAAACITCHWACRQLLHHGRRAVGLPLDAMTAGLGYRYGSYTRLVSVQVHLASGGGK